MHPLSYWSPLITASKFEIHLLSGLAPILKENSKKTHRSLENKKANLIPCLNSYWNKCWKQKKSQKKQTLGCIRSTCTEERDYLVKLLIFPTHFLFHSSDKPNVSDLPRGRLDLLQRDPAGIKPPIGIDFKTKQKKNPFLLLVSCFKPNFCQNRHIASLVFLPHTHTGKCNSVPRAFSIDRSIYLAECAE